MTDAAVARANGIVEMTVAQVRKLLGDIAALRNRLQTRAGVIFRSPIDEREEKRRKAAGSLDTIRPEERNAALVVTTVYESPPRWAKPKRNPKKTRERGERA